MVYNMADKQGDSFTKVVLKKAGRAKERVSLVLTFKEKTSHELLTCPLKLSFLSVAQNVPR